MPINLDRAEKIGGDGFTSSSPKNPNLKFADVEVLTINKTPLSRMSFIKDGCHVCPKCQYNSLKLIIDYRCVKCDSKVIKWRYSTEDAEEKHPSYDIYIERFYESSKAMVDLMKKKKAAKKDG
tara:strand:- start:2578 stop:2946 length:369 start_codon:yes stop_codon:yes gene_type:complete